MAGRDSSTCPFTGGFFSSSLSGRMLVEVESCDSSMGSSSEIELLGVLLKRVL